ncbi:MAG: Rossmann-like fold-containing protein [Minisyncoccia bacterium]
MHYTSENYLKKVRNHSEPYLAEIMDKEIIIFPDVMSPKYDRSPQMIVSMMPNQNGKDVLEIGSGTGILSLFSMFQGAKNVTAVDINPIAVENTKENFNKYNLINNIKVLHSDLFSKVQGVFDTIIFNAPFHGHKAKDILELGTYDNNYETLTRFFSQASHFLKDKGEILLGFANTGNNDLVKSLIDKNNYFIKNFQTYENGDWTMYLYTISIK